MAIDTGRLTCSETAVLRRARLVLGLILAIALTGVPGASAADASAATLKSPTGRSASSSAASFRAENMTDRAMSALYSKSSRRGELTRSL